MKRLAGPLKFLFAIALAPAAVGALIAAARAMTNLLDKPAHTQYFLVGCALYPIVHVGSIGLGSGALRRLVYVLGHELTHAIAAVMSGIKVKGMSVGADGGHVDVAGANVFVALAPYIVPLYALLVVGAYRLWLWHSGGRAMAHVHEGFLLALGLALSFHWVFTVSALWTVKQPDLAVAGGVVFSLVVIALGNAAVVLLALKCLFPKLVSVEHAAQFAWETQLWFWTWVLDLLRRVPVPPLPLKT